MSYILDALRKSEQERQNKQALSLDDQILDLGIRNNSYKKHWLVIGIMVLCIIILSIILLTRTTTNKESTLLSKQSKVKPENQAIPPAKPGKSKQIQDLTDPAARKIKSAASKIEKANDSQPTIAEIIATKRSTQLAKKIKPATPVTLETSPALSEKQNQTATHKPILKSEQPIQISKPAPIPVKRNTTQAPVTQKPTRQESDTPLLKELPFEFRRSVPTLNINVYVYAEDPADRFVLIDMKKFIPGQQLRDGMKLKDILHDSIVVSYKNKTFRIKRP